MEPTPILLFPLVCWIVCCTRSRDLVAVSVALPVLGRCTALRLLSFAVLALLVLLCLSWFVCMWARVRVFGLSGEVFHIFIALMCDFAYGFPHGYGPYTIELPLGTI